MKLARAAATSARFTLLSCTAIASSLACPAIAIAQNAAAAPQQPNAPLPPPSGTVNTGVNTPTGIEPPPSAPVGAPTASEGSNRSGLQEIVVTAQRREQRLQDVPIAITAITQKQLEGNRVVTVNDLSGLAPNVTARASAGGSQIPSFTARGVTSYGVVPGSDKEFSIYLDGVYLGSSRSLFDLPDIERIEVLRGPQGTLFGRNATAGAVSVVTRDPAGSFGVHQDLTVGNYEQLRTRTTIDTPSFGPFSAYASYVHDERRGDIRNLGAGTRWDRSGPETGQGVQYSPRYLGNKNNEQVFAALKFEPSDTFKAVYKFDYQTNNFSAEGVAPVAFSAAGAAATFAPALGPLALEHGGRQHLRVRQADLHA